MRITGLIGDCEQCHIHLNGRYTFRGDGQPIDPEAIVELG
jgi:hypothetical protein